MTNQRHIIIGDIHGCAEELFALLDACNRRPKDEVVSVGDLIDRGPDPESVIRFFMSDPNATAILGNHEDKHVRMRTGELKAGNAQLLAQIQLGDFYAEAVEWFSTLPLSLERCGHFICHAGVIPGVPISEQPRQALLRAKMPWMANIFDSSATPWWERYEGHIPIIFGHTVFADGVQHVNNTWGIDTGACRGHRLSALILPEAQVVSVPAGENHYRIQLAQHRDAIAALEAEQKQARSAERKQRRQKPPKPGRPAPIVIEGEIIHGGWVLAQRGAEPGPWVRETLAEIRSEHDAGRLSSLDEVRALLRGEK